MTALQTHFYFDKPVHDNELNKRDRKSIVYTADTNSMQDPLRNHSLCTIHAITRVSSGLYPHDRTIFTKAVLFKTNFNIALYTNELYESKLVNTPDNRYRDCESRLLDNPFQFITSSVCSSFFNTETISKLTLNLGGILAISSL